MYGILSPYSGHIDVSNTLLGAKQYATRNGYACVTKRANAGYHVSVVAKRVNGKWRAV